MHAVRTNVTETDERRVKPSQACACRATNTNEELVRITKAIASGREDSSRRHTDNAHTMRDFSDETSDRAATAAGDIISSSQVLKTAPGCDVHGWM